MIVNDEVVNLLNKAANAHLYEVMGNKGVYMIPDNFSTVQYMNLQGHIQLLKLKELVVKALVKVDRMGAYLNIGTACGHLELANRLMKEPVHISSVEWDVQYKCCEKIREMFEVPITHICNNVLEDNFEIFDCKTYFDYVILERFFPVYRSDTHDRTEEVLKKFKPYAKRALVIESDGNWTKEQWDWITKVSERRIKISGEWNCFVVKLEHLV